MRLSAYPFPAGLRNLERLEGTRTSELLEGGLAVSMTSAGLPFYTPIGERVLGRIERRLQDEFEAAGFGLVRLPAMVRTSDLEGGEAIGDQFASKIIHLAPPLNEFHLLTTPEMAILRALGPAFSHAQLPIRLCYTADFFRNAGDPRSFLVCRQFRIFGGLVIDDKTDKAAATLDGMLAVLRAVIGGFGINVRELKRGEGGFEMFCPTVEGDYRPDHVAVGDPEAAQRLLSLGMAYRFGRGAALPARVRTAANRNRPVQVSTLGFCTNRLLFAAFDAGRTRHGFRLPAALRPFDVAVIGRTPRDEGDAARLADALGAARMKVAFDDRYKLSRTEREAFATALGIPQHIVCEGGRYEHAGPMGEGRVGLDSLDATVAAAARGAAA